MPNPAIPAIGTITDPGKTRVALVQGQQIISAPATALSTAVGLVPGGTTGQVLTKASDADYDTEWADTGDFSGPASATDGNLVAFDGTAGKLGKDSGKKPADFATAAQGAKADTAVQANGSVGMTAPLDLSNASAGQIIFPATANLSSNANTLDDYEEGTWTPGLTFATPGDLSVVYSTRTGTYVKIGKLVIFSCLIVTTTFTYSTAASYLNITGFPFTMNASFVGAGPVLMNGWTFSGRSQLNFETNNSASTFMYVLAGGSGAIAAELQTAHVASGGNIRLYGSGFYTTNQ